jgi:hypothetical protein
MERTHPREALRRWLVTGAPPPAADEETATALLEEGCAQGLTGLLGSAAEHWPEPVRQRRRSLELTALADGVRRLEVAGRLQRTLGRAGHRALPLKGAALAEALYASPAERPMDDVDLLVLDDWPGAVRHLEEQGLRELERADHARSYLDPDSGVVVELHHAATSCPGLFALDGDGLWARSRAAAGALDRRPSPEDLLVLLALHAAFQHGLVLRLVQYCDFRRLLEREAPDAALTLAIAERCGGMPALAAALAAAQVVVEAPVPAALATGLRAHVPRPLRRAIEGARREPLRLVSPAAPALLRTRWALARTRRALLLRATVSPREPGAAAAPRLRTLLRAGRRTAALLWRHGAHGLVRG